MNVLAEIRSRFLSALTTLVQEPEKYADMVRPSQDPKFGDYQANCAMPMKKELPDQQPREIAQTIIDLLKIDDLCEVPEIAGPGFINLRLKQAWLESTIKSASQDAHLGVTQTDQPRTYVIDYSGPNVAKPMHVGHIRSTVIGDSLTWILRYLGHQVIADNHIGDWGTQFGMIIYGYKHFRDDSAYQSTPVLELARLYRLVRQLADYPKEKTKLSELETKLSQSEKRLEELNTQEPSEDKSVAKKFKKEKGQLPKLIKDLSSEIEDTEKKIAAVESSPELSKLAQEHADIGEQSLLETAKLHSGDEENTTLWNEFLPKCQTEIDTVYERLNIEFDYTNGESIYHDMLAPTVEELVQKGVARESEGAMCVFFDKINTPFLIQKKDGAFLYSTTDLATIKYRMDKWNPDAMLYVVDHRQSLHFEQLFETAKLWGYADTELKHVSFGTVLGEDGKPFKTRSGDTVGLESLLDEAESRSLAILKENEASKAERGLETHSEEEQKKIASVVGIGAVKYADLSHNRTSDYTFSYEKMMATEGNTGAYMQYAYARCRSIIAKSGIDLEQLRNSDTKISLDTAAEKSLAIELLRFSEALNDVIIDYRPNQLTNYLFDLSNCFSSFWDKCPVNKEENLDLKNSRLILCDLTANVIGSGLQLLGIKVVEKM